MAYRCRATHINISVYDIRNHSSSPLNRFTYSAIINLYDSSAALQFRSSKSRSNFGEVDVAPAKTDKVNKVEK